MRYVMLALLSLTLSSPLLVGCNQDSKTTRSHNPITGTDTTKTESHTDTNP